MHTEAVVGGKHIDVLRRHAGHRVHLLRYAVMRRVVKVFETRPELCGIDVFLGPAKAAHQHRLVFKVFGHVGAAHDDRDPAVVDQAVVVQPQRFCHVPRVHIVVDGDGLAVHHRVRIQAGVLAKRHRDGPSCSSVVP